MKLFVLTSRVPWPLEKGDKLRAYHQLKQLSASFDITLIALNDQPLHPDAEKELKKFCKAIHVFPLGRFTVAVNMLRGLFSGLPLQVAYFYSPAVAAKIKALIDAEKPDRIYCQLIRTTMYVRDVKNVPAVIDFMDIFSKGVERRISKVNAMLRPLFRMELKRLLRYEKAVFEQFDERIIISEQDRDLLPHTDRLQTHVVYNGVDTDYFRAQEVQKKYTILFNGNMNYPPNIESAEYLVRRILPIVHRTHPEVNVLISGATPAARIVALQSDKVTVSGWVEDVRTSFAASVMLVAPMQSSIGLQNKLLEAMAMQLPCITSPLSNNALGAKPGTEILVAETPEAYAAHIIRLLGDAAEVQRLGEAGLQLVKNKFNWEACCAQLAQIISHAETH